LAVGWLEPCTIRDRASSADGLIVTLDQATGAILRLEYPESACCLKADAEEAGLVDAAYPLPRIRTAAPCGSVQFRSADPAKPRAGDSADRYAGATRTNFTLEGTLGAEVTLRASTDGHSVILSCQLTNGTRRPIPQVVFPDLRGLVDVAAPTDDPQDLWFRLRAISGTGCAGSRRLVCSEQFQPWSTNPAACSTACGRAGWTWRLNGGLSIFPRRWGWDPHTTTVVQLRQATRRLRLLCRSHGNHPAGGTWSSGEWVLTPHRNGWAKGIEPFRAWCRPMPAANTPMPRHIREGLGYRTVLDVPKPARRS